VQKQVKIKKEKNTIGLLAVYNARP